MDCSQEMVKIKTCLEEKNIVLTGFMGTGKTAVGRILAARLERFFFDTDIMVEEKIGLSIPSIFEKYGENFFRDRETETLEILARHKKGSLVVATGGGAVLRAENRRLLKELGLIFLLRASAEEICRRTATTGDRPLLNEPDPHRVISELLEARESCYRDCDYVIDTTAKTPRQVAVAILSCLNRM